MTTTLQTGSYKISTTLKKAFRIIECIAEHQPVPAGDIRRDVGLTKGNVHSLLASLEYLGYIKRVPSGYILTFKLYALGNTVPLTRDLATIARPVMERIAADTGVNVYLTAPADMKIINLERVKPRSDIQVANDYAVTYDLHCTASGKLYLASMSPEERQHAYREISFKGVTERTIRDAGALEEEIVATQKRGYSVELAEHSPYINGMAAPVRDHNGRFLASLSIIGPTIILTEDVLTGFAPRIMEEARLISEEMGHPRL